MFQAAQRAKHVLLMLSANHRFLPDCSPISVEWKDHSCRDRVYSRKPYLLQMPDMRFREHRAVYCIGVECLLKKTAGVYHSHIFLLQFEQLLQLLRFVPSEPGFQQAIKTRSDPESIHHSIVQMPVAPPVGLPQDHPFSAPLLQQLMAEWSEAAAMYRPVWLPNKPWHHLYDPIRPGRLPDRLHTGAYWMLIGSPASNNRALYQSDHYLMILKKQL